MKIKLSILAVIFCLAFSSCSQVEEISINEVVNSDLNNIDELPEGDFETLDNVAL